MHSPRRAPRLVVVRGDPIEALRAWHAPPGERGPLEQGLRALRTRRDARVTDALAADGIRPTLARIRSSSRRTRILTSARKPFTVFTPYARVWRMQKATPAARTRASPPLPDDLDVATIPLPDADALGFASDVTLPKPGEAAARARLRAFAATDLPDYEQRRDFPGQPGTSGLSPYLRFGVVSARTVHAATAGRSLSARAFTTELIWRDFYQQLLFHHPNLERQAFRPALRALPWENDRGLFAAWQRGETGFPIVDAAMRQLRATGWMHNRCRMIVASFLTKDLLVDWRWGERHFMRELLDGDLAANNGGWQWAASTGTDAQPWFRIFNPTTQGERFDPDGAYVRQWVPELRDVPTRWIHQP
jgi:deoxyribodipyrimidine photo-lyase